MARDYKPKRKRPGSGFSGWIGVVCGLAAGLAIAAAVYVKDHRPDPSGVKLASKPDKKSSRDGDPGEAAAAVDHGGAPCYAQVQPLTRARHL